MKFTWIERCEENFREAKEKLALVPILTLSKIGENFVIMEKKNLESAISLTIS